MSRRLGLAPATAQEQGQKHQHSSQATQSLPTPTGSPPFRVTSEQLALPPANGKRVFHVIGDSGGVKDPNPQIAVANALIKDLEAHPEIGFLDHVGDVDYFNGEQKEYGPQFFEPYAKYLRHCLAIPGNHDGDALPGEPSLSAFVRYFCDTSPRLLPEVEEYNTDTMTLPNVYWTLVDEQLTLISLYSNVPSGGVIEPDQAQWLEGELKAARTDVPLIVQLHHPPYSADAHHGGSQKMGDVLDAAFTASGRTPDLVLSGHVHDFQRFTRTLNGKQIPYIVCGAGGYHNLHKMAKEATKGEQVAEGVTLDAWEDSQYGFLRLTVEGAHISGEYVGVAKDGTVTPAIDTFSVG
jgi:calcineurin-like phosphoesterase family protein